MNNDLILKEIEKQNQHWKGGVSWFSAKQYKRKLFNEFIKYLDEEQILSIIGLRRTGKTTLIKQVMQYLMDKNNVKPRDILFISFDEALVTSKLSLDNYLNTYLEKISETDTLKFIFLDEIQYIDKWQHILKRYYDTRGKIKFIISGSSSLFIKKKITESLAGRIYEFKLNHLNFEEFLEISKVENKIIKEYKKFAIANLDKITRKQNEYQLFLAQYGTKFEKLFEDYLLYYQFPETIFKTDKQKIYKYITDAIYKKTIEYDIPRLFDVDKIDELKFIFQIFINEMGNIIEYTNISKEAGVELNTLKKYIYYFNESLLFNVIYNYSKSFRKSKRLQKKGYVASTNFFTTFHPEYFEQKIISNQYIGKLAENYVYNILKDKFQYISFYRKGNNEIDFVCGNEYLNKQKIKLIEVKYTDNLSKEKFLFLKNTAQNIFKSLPYYIFSKNNFIRDKNKIIIPCFLISA
ncbi:ATP-binding protein [Candidatus Kuenenbacteria bacterium]|nr:ATP-binding protein [Candidatus Kuenenbacteria bacterium]